MTKSLAERLPLQLNKLNIVVEIGNNLSSPIVYNSADYFIY